MPNWEPLFQYENKQPPGTVKGKWCGYCISLYGSDARYRTSSGVRGVSAVYVNPETLEVWSDYMFADKYDQEQRKPGTPITGPWVDEPEEAASPDPVAAVAAVEPPQDKRQYFCQKLKAKYNLELEWEKITYIGEDGIDYDGGVFWNHTHIRKIPVKFRKVKGFFSCDDCALTTLENAPVHVGGNFTCSMNHLASLEHAPAYVGGNFSCFDNHLPKGTKKPPGVGGRFIIGMQTPKQAQAAAEPSSTIMDNVVRHWTGLLAMLPRLDAAVSDVLYDQLQDLPGWTKHVPRTQLLRIHAGGSTWLVFEGGLNKIILLRPGQLTAEAGKLPRNQLEHVFVSNNTAGFSYFRKAVLKGHVPADEVFGNGHGDGPGPGRTVKQALQRLLAAAFSGKVEAAAEPVDDNLVPELWCKFTKSLSRKKVVLAHAGQRFDFIPETPGDIWGFVTVRETPQRDGWTPHHFFNIIEHKLHYDVKVRPSAAPIHDKYLTVAETKQLLQHPKHLLVKMLSMLELDPGKAEAAAEPESDTKERFWCDVVARFPELPRTRPVTIAGRTYTAGIISHGSTLPSNMHHTHALVLRAGAETYTVNIVNDRVFLIYINDSGATDMVEIAGTEDFHRKHKTDALKLAAVFKAVAAKAEAVRKRAQASEHAPVTAAAEPPADSGLLWYDVVDRLPEPGQTPLRVQAHGTVFELTQLLAPNRYQPPLKRNPANAASALVLVEGKKYSISIANARIWVRSMDTLEHDDVGPGIYEFERKHKTAREKIAAVLDVVWRLHKTIRVQAAAEPATAQTAAEWHARVRAHLPGFRHKARLYRVGNVNVHVRFVSAEGIELTVSRDRVLQALITARPFGKIVELYALGVVQESAEIKGNFNSAAAYVKELLRASIKLAEKHNATAAAEPEPLLTRQQGVDYVQTHVHVPAGMGRTNMLDVGFHFGQGVYLNFRDGKQAVLDGKIGGSSDWSLLIEWCGVNLFTHTHPTVSVLRSAVTLAKHVSDYVNTHNTNSFQQIWAYLSRYRTRYGVKTAPKSALLAFAERSWEVRRGRVEAAAEPAQDPREVLCEKLKTKFNLSLDPEKITYMGRGGIDYDGSVIWTNKNLTRIPVRFRSVTGYFSCSHNHLTTLENAPVHVGGNFSCSHNHLTTLAGAPGHVGVDFSCSHNRLTTLEHAPGRVGGDFYCSNNRLTTLEHAPGHVGGYFNCHNNRLPRDTKPPKGVNGKFVLGEQTPARVHGAVEPDIIREPDSPLPKLPALKLLQKYLPGARYDANEPMYVFELSGGVAVEIEAQAFLRSHVHVTWCGVTLYSQPTTANHVRTAAAVAVAVSKLAEANKHESAADMYKRLRNIRVKYAKSEEPKQRLLKIMNQTWDRVRGQVQAAAEPPGAQPAGPVLLELWWQLEKRGGQDYDIKQRHKAFMSAQPGHIVSVRLWNKRGLGMSHSITATPDGAGVKLTYLRNGSWYDEHVPVTRDRDDLVRKIMHAFISSIRAGEEVGDVLFRAVGAAEPPPTSYKPENVFEALEEFIRNRGTGTTSKELHLRDRSIKIRVMSSRILGGVIYVNSRQSARQMRVSVGKPDKLNMNISPRPYSNHTLTISDFKSADELLREILRLYKADCDLDHAQAAVEPASAPTSPWQRYCDAMVRRYQRGGLTVRVQGFEGLVKPMQGGRDGIVEVEGKYEGGGVHAMVYIYNHHRSGLVLRAKGAVGHPASQTGELTGTTITDADTDQTITKKVLQLALQVFRVRPGVEAAAEPKPGHHFDARHCRELYFQLVAVFHRRGSDRFDLSVSGLPKPLRIVDQCSMIEIIASWLGIYIEIERPAASDEYFTVAITKRGRRNIKHVTPRDVNDLVRQVLMLSGILPGKVQAAAEPAQDPREILCSKLKSKYNLELDPERITYMGRDGIDYDGTVNWKSKNLTRIPVRFRKVTGNFFCRNNHLTTLAGAPGRVGGGFYCGSNHLTTLAGAPGHVGGDFYCYNNHLTTLEHAPGRVGGDFICSHNHLPPGTKKPVGVKGRFYFGIQTPAPVHGAVEPYPEGEGSAALVIRKLWTTLNPARRARVGKYEIVYKTGAHHDSNGVVVDLVDGDTLVAQIKAELAYEHRGKSTKAYVRVRLLHGSVPVPGLAVVNNITTSNSMLRFLGSAVCKHAGVRP